MLEKPSLPDEKIITCLQEQYSITANELTFLPLGADVNTAVYRATANAQTPYFLKLRSGNFDKTSVELPKFFSEQGITQIIPPLITTNGRLWGNLDSYHLILYPFIEGRNGYEMELSDRHWHDFGTALKKIHTAPLPSTLTSHIQQETYSSQWREMVKMFLIHLEGFLLDDELARKTAVFLQTKRDELLRLVEHTQQLANTLQQSDLPFIVCHADIHAGNVLITANDDFYMVDWDTPILAPKERDLMYVGGGQFGNTRTPAQEAALFYQTYGEMAVDPAALAYYRYERIIQDIAVECQQIFSTTEGGEDRQTAFRYLTLNFLPNSVLEIAYQSDLQMNHKGAKRQ